MTFTFLGPDPLESQLSAVLQRLSDGEPLSRIEVAAVDVKEEPGRRGAHGALLPGAFENEEAASYLADEMACFANTLGGGAIILGIADDGTRIGTELDPHWLRHRIWELTEQRLTVDVREGTLEGARLLVLTTHEAIEPIRHNGRIRWRVDDNCVDVDPTSWHSGRLRRTGADWSLQSSGHRPTDARAVALEIARRYLSADMGSGDDLGGLVDATDPDFLRRLNLVTADGFLTNAGSLLFVETPHPGADYIRREVPGADSTQRVMSAGPLIEQIYEVERASEASNRLVHASKGFAHGKLRAIPERAIREAIVNGLIHRDWLSAEPTTIEHIGDALSVTSPGGFIGGVSAENIITHPAVPRYRSLAQALAALRLCEREGVGVDRMVRDMLAIGRGAPEIGEIAGPYVRVSLLGGDPDAEITGLLADLDPPRAGQDVDLLLLIEHLSRRGWADAERAAPFLQRNTAETAAAIGRLEVARAAGEPVIVPVKGVPPDRPAAHRLSDAVRVRLASRLAAVAAPGARKGVILSWARARGRVSSTEAADLVGVSVPYAGQLLSSMEDEGQLLPGRSQRLGRGFFYVTVDGET